MDSTQSPVLSVRQLYYTLLNSDEYPANRLAARAFATSAIAANTSTEALDADESRLDDCVRRLRSERVAECARLAGELGALSRERLSLLLKSYAPMALVDGCWLQRGTRGGTCDTEHGAALLSLYSHEIGAGQTADNHANLYRDLARSAGLYLPELTSWAFAGDLDVPEEAFSWGVFLLSLAEYPAALLSELVGVTLHYYTAGLPPLLLASRPSVQRHGFAARFLEMHPYGDEPDEHVLRALQLARTLLDEAGPPGSQERGAVWRRIRSGFGAAHAFEAGWARKASGQLSAAAPSARDRMLDLIRRKAPYALGYHQERALAGVKIDAMMATADRDPTDVLEHLARSPWVKPASSRQSTFLTHLTAFGGPMFRVFSPEELETIAGWIDSLPATEARSAEVRGPASPRTELVPLSAFDARASSLGFAPGESEQGRSGRATSRPKARELFHRLMNVEDHPEALPAARAYVESVHARARRKVKPRGKEGRRFFDYSHPAFEAWYEAQHRRQIGRYKPLEGEPPLTREQTVWIAVQVAPLALADGTWLQNSARVGLGHTEIGARLFRIYSDEVGNGQLEWNHPRIYRQLLVDLGVAVPATNSREFAEWPAFVDAAFDVPTYFLSISQFPKRFFPELLGFNLAFEFSGIGGDYMQVIDIHRYYGIDPYFLELHNVIDNASTGHTALSKEVIELHLDDVLSRSGADAVQQEWRRIWTGFLSLELMTKSILFAYARRLGPSVLKWFIRTRLKRLLSPRPAAA